ncbi:hypothetical protein D0Z07_2168 [Hyphodiscus hymeniophilus]|uniref:Uncharacterized protein n=1 Tax=Hyphodiscus hymeniophilus TaxID=353542 RepID=A0A9P6VNG6_9HELO|nr:hypothetical protein D0Z07_2168 [Hyphodiscus hymeniophilus]
MKGPSIDQLVYSHMFPKPKSTDPQNFQGLLQRQLVPEVRHETQAFYGHLSSQEAKYPGLDYFYQPHRNRLSRYPWHRRLFRAFDALKLTGSEIAGLTKWEGTRWAKERFEREQGVSIRDTTGDGIEDWVRPDLRAPVQRIDDMDREMEGNENEGQGEENGGAEDEDMDEEDEDSDAEIRSVGIELNERLRAAVAEREAGNAATVMDEEWEQWLKDAVEAGGIPFLSSDLSPNANIPGTRPASNDSPAMHPRLLNAARLGQWQQIPDFLQNMVRQNMEATRRLDRLEDATQTSASNASNASNFSSRLSSGAPRTSVRAAPIPNPSTGRMDPRTAARLDHDFSRVLPPLPPATSRVAPPRIPRSPLSDNTH